MLFQAVESIVSLERGENAEIGISRADDLHVVTAGSKGGDNRSNISNPLNYTCKTSSITIVISEM